MNEMPCDIHDSIGNIVYFIDDNDSIDDNDDLDDLDTLDTFYDINDTDDVNVVDDINNEEHNIKKKLML